MAGVQKERGSGLASTPLKVHLESRCVLVRPLWSLLRACQLQFLVYFCCFMIFQRTFPPTGCENIPVAFYLHAIVEGGKAGI